MTDHQEPEEEGKILHLETGFCVEQAKRGCDLYVLEITGTKYKVANFPKLLAALSYIREEFATTENETLG